MRPGCDLLQLAAASAAFETGLPFTDRMTSPCAQRAGRRAVRIDVGDDRAGLARRQLQPARDLRRQVARASGRSCRCPVLPAPGWSFCGVLRRAGLLLGVEIELVDRDVQRLLLLVAQHLHRHLTCPAWSRRPSSRARRGSATGRPLNSTMTSPGSMPAFCAGAARRAPATTIAPVRDFRPKSSKPSRGTAGTDTPMRPRITLPVLQLRQQVADGVDRHGEADADVALGCGRCVKIAVLMPITSPRRFSSGPPELPGLIAASVCSISFERPSVTRNGRARRADHADA